MHFACVAQLGMWTFRCESMQVGCGWVHALCSVIVLTQSYEFPFTFVCAATIAHKHGLDAAELRSTKEYFLSFHLCLLCLSLSVCAATIAHKHGLDAAELRSTKEQLSKASTDIRCGCLLTFDLCHLCLCLSSCPNATTLTCVLHRLQISVPAC